MESENAEATKAALAKIYLNPESPGSLGGIERLYQAAKTTGVPGVTRKSVRQYLSGEASYSLHRQARRHFTRIPTYAAGIDDQWQADLVDMQALSRANRGVKYLLTVIDVFSKYAWVVPAKNKSAAGMLDAFRTLLDEQAAPRRPSRLQTDKGKEFLNQKIQALLRDTYGIKHFTSWSDMKAAVVERFNRTLKSRMWQYFSARQTNHYLDVLPKLVQSYNHSHHRSIGTTPAQVTKANEQRIWKRLYGTKHSPRPSPGIAGDAGRGRRRRRQADAPLREAHPALPPIPKQMRTTGDDDCELKPGMMVRISHIKGAFEKGYLPNWSEEDFRIREIVESPPVANSRQRTVYKLDDREGEPVHGTWYREEIQPISKNRYLVERIIRRRPNKQTGESECLVKWRGWPTKFNTWVEAADLENIQAAAAERDGSND